MKSYRKVNKGSSTQLRVTGEQYRDDYNKLMTLWRVAENSDGIKSLVISCFKVSGVWGIAHETWGELCEALHVKRLAADRMADEGDVCRSLLSGDPFLKAITSQIKALSGAIPQVTQPQGVINGANELPRKNDMIYQNDKSTPKTAEITQIGVLPAISSPHAAIARDRKLLRIVKSAPSSKWSEIATEAAKHGPPTRESVKAAVDKIAPKIENKINKPKTEPRIASFLNALQDAVNYFQQVLKASTSVQVQAAAGITLYTRRIAKEAKKIR